MYLYTYSKISKQEVYIHPYLKKQITKLILLNII